MLMPVMSISGLPFTIHCATVMPMPPPVRIPIEFRPAATKKCCNSGASPTIGSRSGVKLSGPQKNFLIPICSVTGTLAMVFSRYGPIRSQSGGSSPKEKSCGTPSTRHGAQTGSNMPSIRPPLLAVIPVGRRILEHGPRAVDALDRFCEQVVVLGGLERDGDSGKLPELTGPHAGAIHHVLGLDIALRRPDTCHRA